MLGGWKSSRKGAEILPPIQNRDIVLLDISRALLIVRICGMFVDLGASYDLAKLEIFAIVNSGGHLIAGRLSLSNAIGGVNNFFGNQRAVATEVAIQEN